LTGNNQNRFERHDLKCVVISPSSTIRGLLSSILKELSYTNITTVSDIKTCIEIMETEPVAWVISPVRDGADGNVLHILDIIEKNPALRAMKISIIRDEDDTFIPRAFELGAMSAHKFETSKEACHQELFALIQRVETFEGDCTRVAASYLRDFLMEKGEHQELKRFYSSLLQVYPDNSDILVDLARTLFEAQETNDARMLVQRLLLTAPEKKTQLEEMKAAYLDGEELELAPPSFLAAHFGFHTCLLLDADKNNLETLTRSVKRIGFKEIIAFEDPISLMKWVRTNPTPDLVISEWQLPDIPGPIFLYKLRNRLDLHVPIIIINSKITERDSLWIKELGVSSLVSKPVVEKELFQSVMWTMQQSKGPTDILSLKIKIKILSKKQDKELPRYRQLYMNHPMLIESDRILMEAQLAYDAGCYLHAKKYALDAVRESGDPREALEILSKSLMKLREFDAALRCLENVNVLSPYNVSYLCEIAECHLENGDDQKFDDFLVKAKDLDPDAQVVLETEAKGAMKKGHTDTAKILMQSLKSFKEVLAFMNNRAVALIQVGNITEGLELYQKALASIPDGQPEVRSLLSYNLGLGYARAQKLKEAQKVLNAAAMTKNQNRLRKVNSLRMRVDKALDASEELLFPQDKPPSLEEEQEKIRMLKDISDSGNSEHRILRSDYCVNRIFRTMMDTSKANEAMSSAPQFTPRGKMVKDYINGIKQVPGNFPGN
jgi:tetratricopeptide (TPR) repeat protein